MTNKEAIRRILDHKRVHSLNEPRAVLINEALDLAIKALEEQDKKGEWIIVDDCGQFIAKCSVCGRIEDSRLIKDYPFCHCGADMRGEKNDNE